MPPLMTTADSDMAAAVAAHIALRVRAGMEFLDGAFPGWEREINLDTLNIGNGGTCICGQLFARGRRPELLVMMERCDHGFNAHDHEEYLLLNAEWRVQILQRWSRMDRIAA